MHMCAAFLKETFRKHLPSSLSVPSLGYKPFLNLIAPELQKLCDVSMDQISLDSFQPSLSKMADPVLPRAEEHRGVPAFPLPMNLEIPAGSAPRVMEDKHKAESEDEAAEEGTYDCTLS